MDAVFLDGSPRHMLGHPLQPPQLLLGQLLALLALLGKVESAIKLLSQAAAHRDEWRRDTVRVAVLNIFRREMFFAISHGVRPISPGRSAFEPAQEVDFCTSTNLESWPDFVSRLCPVGAPCSMPRQVARSARLQYQAHKQQFEEPALQAKGSPETRARGSRKAAPG